MDTLLGAQVAAQNFYESRRRVVIEWMRRDDGQEAGVEKLILIGAAIAVAVAAGVFFVTKFGEAKSNVDTPTKISVP